MILLKNLGQKTHDRYKNKGITKEDLQLKEATKEQCDAASESLFAKKRDLQRADREYEEDMRRYTEIKNKGETLNERRSKLISQLNALSKEIQEGAEKQERARKSLGVQNAHFNKNRIEVNTASPHYAQLEYDLQVNKNKTLLTCLIDISEQIPEVGPILEEILKEKNIELPQRAPSEVDMMSSKGMSVRSGASGQSAISRASRQSSSQRRWSD